MEGALVADQVGPVLDPGPVAFRRAFGDFLRIFLSEIIIHRIENEKIAEMREEFDTLGLYQQLGMDRILITLIQ
jgi:hypothetical protein